MVQGSESILSATILCGLQVTRSIPHDLIISASKLGRGLEEALRSFRCTRCHWARINLKHVLFIPASSVPSGPSGLICDALCKEINCCLGQSGLRRENVQARAQVRHKPAVQSSQAVKASLREAVSKGGHQGVLQPGSAVALPRERDNTTVLLSTP